MRKHQNLEHKSDHSEWGVLSDLCKEVWEITHKIGSGLKPSNIMAMPRLVITSDNDDAELARERNSSRKGQSLKTALANYFNFGIHTSVTVAKWIAYVTKV